MSAPAASPRMAGADDAVLVARVRRGDRDALGELYSRHRAAVARYMARRVVCSGDVEDLVQETFIRVPEMAGDYNPDRDSYPVGAWLCGRVGRWTLIDYSRKERRSHLSALDAARDVAYRALTETAHERESRPLSPRVVTALARLTPAQRRATQLRYLDGLSSAQAAEVAGTSPGAVAQNSLDARKRLRVELADLAPAARSEVAELPKVAAVRAAFAAVRRDVPAAQAWLGERGVTVDPSYLYAIRNGRRGVDVDRRRGPRTEHGHEQHDSVGAGDAVDADVSPAPPVAARVQRSAPVTLPAQRKPAEPDTAPDRAVSQLPAKSTGQPGTIAGAVAQRPRTTREAVAEVHRQRLAHEHHTAGQSRGEQLTRWHADDQVAGSGATERDPVRGCA